jgi:hypothetical protein
MRKQELVQLHALCDAVRTYLETRRDVPSEAFRAYDEDHVSPTALHCPKRVHEESLGRLLDGLVTAVDTDSSSARSDVPTGRDE